jgi:hypothetical protein
MFLQEHFSQCAHWNEPGESQAPRCRVSGDLVPLHSTHMFLPEHFFTLYVPLRDPEGVLGTRETAYQPRMFLQEHWTRFAHQFTHLHSSSSLHLKCGADYAAV